MRSGLLLALLLTSSSARAEIAGEVPLETADDLAALCGELATAEGEDATKIRGAVYVMHMPSTAFALLPYDGHRARVVIDAARGFRGKDAGYELVLHDLGGTTRAKTPTLDMAIPASSTEAKTLAKAHHAGTLTLKLWFRVAARAADVPVCARVHTATGEGTRFAIEPMAFMLAQGTERLASGETAAFAALREAAAGEARVTIAAPMQTKGGKASDAVAKAAAALEKPLLDCYRDALVGDADLRGALVLGVDVAQDGRVLEAKAEIDGLGDAALVTCALDETRRLRFPKQAGRFSVPIKFARK